jgi:hypothetical protein
MEVAPGKLLENLIERGDDASDHGSFGTRRDLEAG